MRPSQQDVTPYEKGLSGEGLDTRGLIIVAAFLDSGEGLDTKGLGILVAF